MGVHSEDTPRSGFEVFGRMPHPGFSLEVGVGGKLPGLTQEPFLGTLSDDWVSLGDFRDTSHQLGQEERCFGASPSHQKDRSTAGLGQQERRTGTQLGGAQPLLSAMISQLRFQTTGHLSTRPQLCQQEGLQPGLS